MSNNKNREALTLSQQNKQFLTVPVESLKTTAWDVRLRPDSPEEFKKLKESIERNGLIHNINVVRMSNGDLVVLTGRRRLKAIKELGWKETEIEIKYTGLSEEQFRDLVVSENVDRRNIADMEKGYAIIRKFEAAGYSPEQVYGGVKSIDNWFHNNVGKTWDDLTREPSSLVKGPQANPLRHDTKFIDVCRNMSWTPKYQYQLLEIVLRLPRDVLIAAENYELNYRKKLLLTHTLLRDHPEIQMKLIKKIKDVTDLRASTIVAHEIKKLQQPEEDEEEGEPEKDASQLYLDIMESSGRMLYLLNGRSLTKGEYDWTEEMVENGQEHRYKIVKSTDVRELNSMYKRLILVKQSILDTLDIMGKELDVVKKKQDMGGR